MASLLIADDSAGKIMMMQGMLFRKKWTGDVLKAATTDEAKKLIDENVITHAFIDYYIPSENGPAVIAYLKQKNPDARIALVSSADSVDNFEEAKRAGAEECICTSYEADEVERAFMNLLQEWIA
jgi:two-component system, response regulator RegA